MQSDLAIFLANAWSVLLPAFVTVLVLFLCFVLVYMGKQVRRLIVSADQYLSSKMDGNDYLVLRQRARDLVLMLMQHPAYKDLTGPEKKARAAEKLLQFAREVGLPFDSEQVDELIEAVYSEIRRFEAFAVSGAAD